FPVVHADRLAGLEHDERDPELRKVRLRLERGPAGEREIVAAPVAADPARVARVQHEPALASGDEAGLGLVERSLGAHRSRVYVFSGSALGSSVQSIAPGDRSKGESPMKAYVVTLAACAAAVLGTPIAQAHLVSGEGGVASAKSQSALAAMIAAGTRYHAAA